LAVAEECSIGRHSSTHEREMGNDERAVTRCNDAASFTGRWNEATQIRTGIIGRTAPLAQAQARRNHQRNCSRYGEALRSAKSVYCRNRLASSLPYPRRPPNRRCSRGTVARGRRWASSSARIRGRGYGVSASLSVELRLHFASMVSQSFPHGFSFFAMALSVRTFSAVQARLVPFFISHSKIGRGF
jgi:hypothetical protein